LTGRLFVGAALALMALVLLSAVATPTQPLKRAQENQARMQTAPDVSSVDSHSVSAATRVHPLEGTGTPHWIA